MTEISLSLLEITLDVNGLMAILISEKTGFWS